MAVLERKEILLAHFTTSGSEATAKRSNSLAVVDSYNLFIQNENVEK